MHLCQLSFQYMHKYIQLFDNYFIHVLENPIINIHLHLNSLLEYCVANPAFVLIFVSKLSVSLQVFTFHLSYCSTEIIKSFVVSVSSNLVKSAVSAFEDN